MIGLEFIAKTFDEQFKTIAESLGISPKTVNDWVKERKDIPIPRRKQLAEHFRLKEDYFQKKLTQDEELDILMESVSRHMIANAEVIERTIVDELGDENLIEDTYYEPELQEKMRLLNKKQEMVRLFNAINMLVKDDYFGSNLSFFKESICFLEDVSFRRLIFLLTGSITPGFGNPFIVDRLSDKEKEFTEALRILLLKFGYKRRKHKVNS